MLAGITLVANGTDLKYPYEVCIRNLLNCCDKVFVSTDTENRDDTLTRLLSFGERVEVIRTAWDWSVSNGTDLAHRANVAAEIAAQCGYTEVLYVQADEIVSPDEINRVKLWSQSTALSLERTYFWKDLKHVNLSWTTPICRMGPLTPSFRVQGDGMYASFGGAPVVSVPPDVCRIYHYSRVGETADIATRLNTLDSLFHDEGTYTPLDDYRFGQDNNFEEGASSAAVVPVAVRHPPGIEEFYDGFDR